MSEFDESLQAIAKHLDEELNGEGCPPESRVVGFTILVFTPSRSVPGCAIVSTDSGTEMIDRLRENVAFLERHAGYGGTG